MSEDAVDELENDENEDIYKDIGDFHFDKELTKLEESNRAYLEDIARLSEKLKQLADKNIELQNVNDILVTNISILLKTAKAEIERKQLVIDEFRKKIESMSRKNWYDKGSEAQRSEICQICAGNIESQETVNPSDIEDGEIVWEDCEVKNSNFEMGRREYSNPREDRKDYPVDHTRRRNERSRGRSSEKYSSSHNLRNLKRSSDNSSRHSASSRSRHRYDSPDKRHSDRRRRSREKRVYSTRSDYSSNLGAPKERERRKEEYRKSQERYSHSSKRSSSRRNENPTEEESRSQVRCERKLLETAERVASAKECKSKDLKPDRDVVKREAVEKERRESQNKEKCDIVKKLSIGEYHQRRSNSSSSVRKESDGNLFARQSVLEDLYEEPVTSRTHSEAPQEIPGKNPEVAAGSDYEAVDYPDWSSDESWSVIFGKKTEPPKKPQTLYSRRMEAKLQQQLKEEALALQNLGDYTEEKLKTEDGKKCSTETDRKEESLEGKSENSPDVIKSNGQANMETGDSDVREEEKGEDKLEESEQGAGVKGVDDDVKAADVIVDEGEAANPIADAEDGESDVQSVEERKRVPEGDASNGGSSGGEKIVEEDPESTRVPATNPVPEQGFGENLVKKLLQLQKCEDPPEIKEFSPLKNNYKLSKISPVKAVPKQHILEYYNLKPSAQILTNIEPEILDFSFSLPETPGKNFSHAFSALTFSQVPTREENVGASDPTKTLEEDKPQSEVNKVEENISDAVHVDSEGEAVTENRKSDDDTKKERSNSLVRRGSKAADSSPISKSRRGSHETLEQNMETEQLDEEHVPSNNLAGEGKVSAKAKKDSQSAKGREETKEGPEKPYQIRTRSRNRSVNARDRKSSVKNGASKKRTSGDRVEKGKSEETGMKKRKRRLTSSDEEEENSNVVSNRKKCVKKKASESGEVVECPVREVDGNKSEESKAGGKEAEKAFPGDITSFEVFKNASDDAIASRNESGGGIVESRIEQKTALDDLSLSSFQVTTLSSTMNITGHVLCLETPNKCAGKFKNLTINEETVMQLEEDKSKASLVSVGNSGDSSTFKILRSYLMLSANDDSEMEVFTENSSCSSGEYSDSGASAFVDLL